MTCRECDEDGVQRGLYDEEGCIDGQFYGYCTADECYGLCEWQGRCDCECHK